jgi:hypothetical protein
MKANPREYEKTLLRIAQRPSLKLKTLNSCWKKTKANLDKKRQQLRKNIRDKHDPVYSSVDLLSPIKREAVENTHTQVLAFLFDEKRAHGLSKSALTAVLDEVKCQTACDLAKLLQKRGCSVTVIPEYRYREQGGVLARANEDARELLVHLKEKLNEAAGTSVRVKWNRESDWGKYWQNEGEISLKRRGQSKSIGSIGLYIDDGPRGAQLIAWIWLKGDKDYRIKFGKKCKEKNVGRLSEVWDDEETIWFEKPISLKTTRDDLSLALKKAAKRLLKVTIPLLKQL